jgi:hypothetical protein
MFIIRPGRGALGHCQILRMGSRLVGQNGFMSAGAER